MRGIKYNEREKLKALKLWRQEGKDILWVAKKMKCTERTLWRWLSLYDGTIESLKNNSSRPHTKHPNAHTIVEQREIIRLFKKHPDMSYAEALGEMRARYAYNRTYGGFYRYIVKNHLRNKPVEERKEDYSPQPYDTPLILGQKMQMDVKYVPRVCYTGTKMGDRFYQYTMIDEATRERFIYPYKEQSSYSTVDFVKRAIVHFGYVPKCIQTDNGTEFTNPKQKGAKKMHPLDILAEKINFNHRLIRAYTPRHNGKVERSHRTDQECFYNHLEFKTFEELQEKMMKWLIRYNNKPHSSLKNREGKKVWQTPIEKRKELIEILKEQEKAETSFEAPVRFLKSLKVKLA